MLFPPIGEEGQHRLFHSRVAVVGLGALGTALSHHMVRAGVGYVRLIDRDFVEPSNLQRQMLFDEADAEEGIPKAIAAEQKLTAINSQTELESHVADLTANNAESLLTGVDVILDGTDNFAVRYLINDVSVKHGLPWIYGGVVSSRGMTFTIRPGITPCLRCLFPDSPAPGTAETCDTAGVIGPAVQVVAAFQATEALKLLVGDMEALNPHLRHFELWHNHDAALQGQKRDDCPACGQHRYQFLEAPDRSDSAVSLCGRDTVQISPAKPHPLDLEQLEATLSPLGKVERNRFLLRAQVDGDHRLVLFPDGRILVQGTDDPALARSLVARYIGA
ncbi:MAG: ThiF family adenylyltransferase [Firmicutes bacterium]|nr:ThiF family adenylyltransferase [Melghirimyces thermohalophilus]MDA8352784.1 ThiF family adenylyltransferase [Bacillota bacterium]